MSWIMNLLQDVPVSAVLRERLGLIETKFRDAEAKIASLESEKEISDLKTANCEERVAILERDKAKLEKQIEDFSHINTLSEEERLHKLTELLAKIRERASKESPN